MKIPAKHLASYKVLEAMYKSGLEYDYEEMKELITSNGILIGYASKLLGEMKERGLIYKKNLQYIPSQGMRRYFDNLNNQDDDSNKEIVPPRKLNVFNSELKDYAKKMSANRRDDGLPMQTFRHIGGTSEFKFRGTKI